jgi:predicted P-loop ATPase
VKDDQDLFGLYFKKWLVAVIASLVDPTVVNHEILVFVGKQGIYKTTWMQRLLPPELQRYFYVKSNSQHIKKDDLFTLTEFALVCLEELEEMTSVQVGQLKAITSMNMVNERAFYGHFKESRPHVASFCGTTNNSTFLNDLSGSPSKWRPSTVLSTFP